MATDTTQPASLLELLELRRKQDRRWPRGHVRRQSPLAWYDLAITQLSNAIREPEDPDAFRRRVLRATSYLLASVESFDAREAAHLSLFADSPEDE